MKNKRGITITEKIRYDIEIAKAVKDDEQRRLLAYMAISAAELAIDFELITNGEWGYILNEAFNII